METFSTSEKSKSISAVSWRKNNHQPFFAPVKVQPKLTVGPVNDPSEHEAESMADKVMLMPVQRACTSCEKDKLRRYEKRPEEEEKVQKKDQGNSTAGMEAPSIVHDAINSGGQPLDTGTRKFFEPRFGRDFSNVRLHTGSKAAESSQAINANAYTLNNNIVFNSGKYSPHTDDGKRLLAHELTHVVQQGQMAESPFRAQYIQKAPTIRTVDQDFIGPLEENQRRIAASCPIRSNGIINMGTLQVSALFYHQSRTGISSTPSASDNGIGTALHFIENTGRRGCPCDEFKIIQIIRTTHPAAGRDGAGYVDNLGNNTPFYSDVALSGQGEHAIPAGYPDQGETIDTTHSIYDRPYRATAGLSSTIEWQAESCVACVRSTEPDLILGGATYGFRMPYNTSTSTYGTIEGIGPSCLSVPSENFIRVLRTDPTIAGYDFTPERGAGDFPLPNSDTRLA